MAKVNKVIALSDLSVGFKSGSSVHNVLNEISGSVISTEFISLIGANGSGKSTLLKTIIGIHPSLSGSVEIFGRDLNNYSRTQLARRVGYVAAGAPVPNSMSVEELVTLGRFPHTNWIGRITKDDRVMIAESIESVGLSSLKHRNLFQISDGEKQRAMIARALAQDPALLVLDEPMAFLDLPNKYDLVNLLRKLATERQKAILISTHDLNIAVSESDKIWLLHNRELSEGAPEDLLISGEFVSLFGKSKLSFIEEEGTFRYPSLVNYYVNLDSDKKLGNLTRRALLRIKVAVTRENSDHRIEAKYCKDGPVWYYSGPKGERSFITIYDLCFFLRDILKNE